MPARYIYLALALAFTGCSDDDNNNTSASDAGLDASTDLAFHVSSSDMHMPDFSIHDAAVPTDFNGVACNPGAMVLLDAIPVMQSTATAPALTGGTLTQGNYVLASQTLYQQADAGFAGYVTEKMYVTLSNGTIALYSDTPDPSSFLSPLFGAAVDGNYTTGTNEIQITTTCGDPTGVGHVYTTKFLATTNTLTINIGQNEPMYLTFTYHAS